MASRQERFVEIVKTCTTVILVGMQVFFIVDMLSDGELSQELSTWITYARSEYANSIRIERTIKEEKGSLLWEAMQIVEEGNA